MKLTIMQPYFLPYIGYWQLIANSDEFIFFDVVQYNKRSWMNRNRVLHPDKEKEFQYVSVPIVKHIRGTLINDVKVNNTEKWKQKILDQLTVYNKLKAPFYEETIELVLSILNQNYDSFLELSIETTKLICEYIDIKFQYQLASNISFDRDSIEKPGDWALEISKKLNATHYINPPGGYEIFDEDKYKLNNIGLIFLKPNLTKYKQAWRADFQAGLSIIDVLMFIHKDEVNSLLLGDFRLMTKADMIKNI